MLGGTGDPGAMDLPDDQIEHIITTELQTLLKLSSTPLKIVIHRWRRAIPVYSPELATVYETLRSDFCAVPGRMISGNYSGQISLRGMADDFYE
jgi:protoporphyrinogen oxidase